MKYSPTLFFSLCIVFCISCFLQRHCSGFSTCAACTSVTELLATGMHSNIDDQRLALMSKYTRKSAAVSRSKMGQRLTESNKKYIMEGIHFRSEYRQLRLLTAEEEQAAGKISFRAWQLRQDQYTIEHRSNVSLSESACSRAFNMSAGQLTATLDMARVARLQLVRHNVRIVDYWVRRLLDHSASAQYVSYYELVVQGVLGLSKAAERFDGRTDCRFATFAKPYVMNELFKGMSTLRPGCFLPPQTMMLGYRAHITQQRLWAALCRKPTDVEVAQALGITVRRMKSVQRDVRTKHTVVSAFTYLAKGHQGNGNGDGNTLTYLDLALNTAQHSAVVDSGQLRNLLRQTELRRLMDCLTATERRTLILRFGLDGARAGGSLSVPRIAQLMCATSEGVRKILDRALHKLRCSEDARALLQPQSTLPADATYQANSAYVTTY